MAVGVAVKVAVGLAVGVGVLVLVAVAVGLRVNVGVIVATISSMIAGPDPSSATRAWMAMLCWTIACSRASGRSGTSDNARSLSAAWR